MLAEELFYITPERLAAVVLLQQLQGGVQMGEVFHAVQDIDNLALMLELIQFYNYLPGLAPTAQMPAVGCTTMDAQTFQNFADKYTSADFDKISFIFYCRLTGLLSLLQYFCR